MIKFIDLLKEEITLRTTKDLLNYENDIIDFFRYRGYSKMGFNGPSMAIRDFLKNNRMKIGPRVDLNIMIDKLHYL